MNIYNNFQFIFKLVKINSAYVHYETIAKIIYEIIVHYFLQNI